MPAKIVTVQTLMKDGFKITSKLGNHDVCIDQPKSAGGNDAGPTPLEYLLFSLAGCVSSIARIAAMQKKIDMRSLDLEVCGELNTDGLLGKETDDRVGFKSFNIKAKLDADLSDEEKQAFLEEVDNRCPVSENLMNGIPISIELIN